MKAKQATAAAMEAQAAVQRAEETLWVLRDQHKVLAATAAAAEAVAADKMEAARALARASNVR